MHCSNRIAGELYGIMVYRNYLDSRFCPVLWLLTWLWWSGLTKGPLFQHKEKGKYIGHLQEYQLANMQQRIMTDAGLYDPSQPVGQRGVTGQGVRKTAIQWAGRCLGNVLDVCNTSRHKDVNQMRGYFNQGEAHRREHIGTDGTCHDPIWGVWVWKSGVVAADDGRNQL
jgi:hypothetical protein